MYPVSYEADYLKERNRLTTFFRLIVVIPWLILAYIYAIAGMVVVVLAWFAILFTGRFPEGMYNFVGGVLRFTQRVNGFMYLQTDAWPPFGLKEEPGYPIRIGFAPPAAKQSRAKTLFRIILVLPLLFMSYLFSLLIQGITVVSWFAIVFRGYQPAAIHNALAYVMSWTTRVSAYSMLMRDEYPPIGDEIEVQVDPPAIDAAAVEAPQEIPAAAVQETPPPQPPAAPPTV